MLFKIPSMILSSSNLEMGENSKEMFKIFYEIHESVKLKDSKISTSRHYFKFLYTFKSIYEKKRNTIAGRQGHLKVCIRPFLFYFFSLINFVLTRMV